MRTSAIPVERTHRWTSIAVLALAAAGIFTIAMDNGQLLSFVMGDVAQQQNLLHEFFHDARHAAGFPCH